MPSLKMVGPTPTSANALTTKIATDGVISGTTTPQQMQDKIDTAVSPYALKSYVDEQDGNFTTKAYADAQDALYMPNSWKGAANGVAENVSSIIPATRFPSIPTFPIVHLRTIRNTDFTPVTTGSAIGTNEFNIYDNPLPLSQNGTYMRFLVFGNFEGWAVQGANLNGKPVIRVYIAGFLVGFSGGRNGNGSGGSCPISVTPASDTTSQTPGSGWNSTSISMRVTLQTPFADTMVSYATVPQTILSVYGISI